MLTTTSVFDDKSKPAIWLHKYPSAICTARATAGLERHDRSEATSIDLSMACADSIFVEISESDHDIEKALLKPGMSRLLSLHDHSLALNTIVMQRTFV
ncbi:MAG: hypothetical protein JJU08_03195 [Rhodobacteraceae bacterium]|nr:hypothetical protein [Paracoccaceae bacterium]